jgi:DMSO/TMAO reductase YedYZ molybdopterin-dependent catalytic subunit
MARRSIRLIVFLLTCAAAASAAEPVLRVAGLEKTMTFTATEFAALPRTELKLPAQADKPEVTFTGVALRELLARVGAPFGEKLRGPALLLGVIVRAKDNYAVLYSLAEFDENFSSRTILLADREDGEILPPSAAPFRVVAPGDKRGARSTKQVVSIEVVSLAKP